MSDRCKAPILFLNVPEHSKEYELVSQIKWIMSVDKDQKPTITSRKVLGLKICNKSMLEAKEKVEFSIVVVIFYQSKY